MSSILALFILLVAAGLFIGYQQVRSQYFVATDNKGNVVIFRGIQQSVLGIPLWTVDQTTTIPKSGLPESDVQGLNGAAYHSLAQAQHFVEGLRAHYLTCQTAFQKLIAWKASKPERITTFEHGRKRVILRKKPRPNVPPMCLTVANHPAL